MNSNDGDSRRRWLSPWSFGIFLLLGLAACFPQIITGSEGFYSRDYGVLGYPNIHFQREAFWRGELPLWNPLSNCGQPFLAQWGTMTLYPLSLIYLLLPLPASLGIFCLAHVWLGGMGMYFLVRHWTKDELGAALGGTAYVFNGIMFASFIWPNYLVTLGWMPWVIWLAERAWREGGRFVPATALVGTMQMLAGAPEVVLLTWLVVAVLWVSDVVRAPVSAGPFIGRMVLVVLLTAGLMAMQLLPFLELLQQSHRDSGFATSKWQLPLWGWANFVVPLFNSFETPSGQYYQYGQGFLSSVYLGGLVLTFSLVGLLRWPDPRVWLLAGLAVVALVLSFGSETPLFQWLRGVIPALGMARYPVKFLFILAFIAPFLAGCGLAAVSQSRQRGLAQGLGVLMLLLMLGIAWAAREQRWVDMSSWAENFRLNVAYSWTKTAPGQWLPDGLLNTGIRLGFFAVSLVLLLRASQVGTARSVLALVGLSLLVVDVRIHTPRQNPTLPARSFTESFRGEGLEPSQLGGNRVMLTPQAEEFLTYLSSTNAQRLWEFKRKAQWSSLNLLDGVSKVNGSTTLQTREQRLLEEALYSMTNRLPAGLLDFLGVSRVSSDKSAADWSPRSTGLPLLSTGSGVEFVGEAETLRLLTNAAFDSRKVVYLQPETRGLIQASNPVPANLSGVSFGAHAIEATVEASAPTVVVVAQSYYSAWKATVDGVEVPLLRANLAFQAVPVPAGTHQIRLRYVDERLKFGGCISAVAFLICLIMVARRGPGSQRVG